VSVFDNAEAMEWLDATLGPCFGMLAELKAEPDDVAEAALRAELGAIVDRVVGNKQQVCKADFALVLEGVLHRCGELLATRYTAPTAEEQEI
jgi:hypothetical protein